MGVWKKDKHIPSKTGYYWYSDDTYLESGRYPDIFYIATSHSIMGSAVIYLTYPMNDIRRLEHMGNNYKISGPIEQPNEEEKSNGNHSQLECRQESGDHIQ